MHPRHTSDPGVSHLVSSMEWPSKGEAPPPAAVCAAREYQSAVNFITRAVLLCLAAALFEPRMCGRSEFSGDWFLCGCGANSGLFTSGCHPRLYRLWRHFVPLINIDETPLRGACVWAARALEKNNKRNFYGVKFICFIAATAADGVVLHGSITRAAAACRVSIFIGALRVKHNQPSDW